MSAYIGINTGGHDSSATILKISNGDVVESVIYLAERFTKIRYQGLFPYSSLQKLYAEHPETKELAESNYSTNSFTSHPREFESQMGSAHADRVSLYGMEKASALFNRNIRFITHHQCHAFSALLQCPFDKALIVVSDGAGNRCKDFAPEHSESALLSTNDVAEAITVYTMDNGAIRPIHKEFMHYTATDLMSVKASNGLGATFEAAARLIFDEWSSAGKVMGLAAYGKPTTFTDSVSFIRQMSQAPFTVQRNKKEFDQQNPAEFKRKADLAASIQLFFEEQMIQRLLRLKKDYPQYTNLILVGGCALNCLLNARIIRDGIFANVFVPPFPNDEGISLGAAIAQAQENNDFKFKTTPYHLLTPALGAHHTSVEMQQEQVPELFANYQLTQSQDVSKEAAKFLVNGEIIAWMQGRSEVGPRALGFRSILVRPDLKDVKTKLNDFVKFREGFRPYGATVLFEKTQDYFEVNAGYQSPFMTFCPQARPVWRDKLAGVVHQDGTTRIQTLMRDQNPRFYDLIEHFSKKAGFAVLLNTSLNIMGQPILETIEDAKLFFEQSQIRIMVIGDWIIRKP